MSDILKDYYDALDRLKRGKPVNVPKSTKITNDSVSLEAGRKKGTIKKSRPMFILLIDAIKAAALEERKPLDGAREQLDQAKAEARRYRVLWEEALAREISLIKELSDAREDWERERQAMATGKVTAFKKAERSTV
jgi:hypothetical protein